MSAISTSICTVWRRFDRNAARTQGRLLWLIGCALLLPLATRANAPRDVAPLRVLIVGGGPELAYNQVAIESNVRYVGRLLPPDAIRTTLFADGDPNHATVLYDDDPSKESTGHQVLSLILYGYDGDSNDPGHFRKPNLGAHLDGASRHTEVNHAFTQIQQEAETGATWKSLLLYFTGHGSSDKGDQQNNYYDLWGADEKLSVRQLARRIAALPPGVPVTLVMVQCFSGAFGNVIFEDGDPQGPAVERDLAGFFATVNNRVAAGCTSAINEAEYHDFTSYFFAALTGRDRLGRRVTGADYDGDGRVSANEAYCYTLIHDESIDVPVCTSDVFLRRFVPTDDQRAFRTPYDRALLWASPAQKAALDALSDQLHLTGEERPAVAYRHLTDGSPEMRIGEAADRAQRAVRRFNEIRDEDRRILLRRYPELGMSRSARRRALETTVASDLTREVDAGRWKELLDAEAAIDQAEQDRENGEIAESHLLRFVRLFKSVVLAHQLEQTGSPALKARFARLQEAESRTILPQSEALARRP
jgi:hypothetical protein